MPTRNPYPKAHLFGLTLAAGLLVAALTPLKPSEAHAGASRPATEQQSLLASIHRAKLTVPDRGSLDHLGYSVAVDGDTAVVGAPGDDTPAGANAGSAYVFVRSGTAWTLQAKLTASDGAPQDVFGWAVAVDGDTAVVGAIGDDTEAGPYAGSAYVYVRSGTTWTEQAHLTASEGAAGDSFGISVAVEGETAVVGAMFESTLAAPDAGSAYVFVRSGTVWTEQAKLTATDRADGDQFGVSVALDADTVVVGAYQDDPPVGTDAGSAYVFVRSGAVWTEQAKLTASDQASFDYFGVSVALDQGTAVVGAFLDSTPAGPDAGSAYVFVRSGTAWTEQAHLTASDGAADDRFGVSVAVVGNTAVVGANLDDTPGGTDAGSAYGFVRFGTTWTERAKLTVPDGAPDDQFGLSVAMEGDTVVVGAPGDDIAAREDAGSAYVLWR